MADSKEWGVCRYIDAPMADVATRQPMLAPMEPMEERAAAARERHALHSAEGMSLSASFLLHAFCLSRSHACIVQGLYCRGSRGLTLKCFDKFSATHAVLAGAMDCAEPLCR